MEVVMWSQPRLSVLVHAAVATGLLATFLVTSVMRQRHPDWYQAGMFGLLPAAVLNYLAAAFHAVRLLRLP
jgi:hypothetical protein